MFSLPQPIENSRQFLFLRFNYLRSSQHGLKKYIKLIYSTSFLCALLLINIPVRDITIIFRRHNFSASHAIAGLFAIPVNSRQPEKLVYTDLALIPGKTTIKW